MSGDRPRPGPGNPRASEHEVAVPAAAPTARRGSALPLTEDVPAGPTIERRRVGHGARLKRSVRRAFRGPRGKWMIAGIAGSLVVIIGLLVSGFLSSPAPPDDSNRPGEVRAGDLASLPPTPSASVSKGKDSSGKGGPATGNDIKKLLQNKLNNPLNNLRAPGTHTVTITARSRDRIPVVGYLVPTGSDVYGAKRNTGSFSLQQKAYGTGYLAAVFIQAGPKGAPVTCTVTVDGRTTNSEATSGGYGRAVCLG